MKKLLLSLCIMLMAGLVSAQCNPQFTAAASPSGNSLLRAAVTNTTVPSLGAGKYAIYSFRSTGATITGNAGIGSTSYVTYSAPGSHSVTLIMTVRDSLMGNVLVCMDSVVQTVSFAYPSCGSTLNYSIAAGGNYSFAAATPSGTAGMTYGWNFGDGNIATGANPTHTYAANGTYIVTLTASSPGNCVYTNTVTVVVNNLQANCSANQAGFTDIINNATASFTNTSTSPSSIGAAWYTWDFGDGGNAYTTNASHTYTTSGTYTVSLVSMWYDSSSTNTCFDTFSKTLNISVPAPLNQISGFVVRTNTTTSLATDPIRVWLISYNVTTNMLQAIDSVTVDSAITASGQYLNYYSFSNVLAGSYLLKAARIGGTVGNNGPIPTYHDSAFYWNTALPITVSGGTNNNNGTITMRSGIISAGNGFIGGNVSLGANRGSAIGVPNMTILLRNNLSNMVLRSTVTDASGNYSFANVPNGLYSIYPEDLGYTTTTAANIAITSAQNSVQAVNFNEDRTGMTIKPRATAISLINANGASVMLYPNPAKGSVTLSWKGFDAKDLEVTISNVTGQLVQTKQISGAVSGASVIDISRLQAGIYTVRIHSSVGDAVQKLVVQH